jgi:rfaE bifunctional protein kinase chain/domain
LLQDRAIQADGLVHDSARPTTTKTRIMALTGLRFPQQVARLDHLDRRPISAEVEAQVIAEIEHRTDIQAILVSDYLTGLVTAPIAQAVVRHARAHGVVALADAQGELDKYQGFDLIKCNADEAARFLQRDLHTDADFETAVETIFALVQDTRTLLITRGGAGVTLAQRGQEAQHLPAPHIEDVFDTVGAGDTVVALMALALAAGIAPATAAQLANLAAGIVIRKVGNYAPSPAELREAIREQSATGNATR